MSDTKLRDLERRWRETGTAEDEAAYLQERVRAGDLSPERLRLAACCEHEAAFLALGQHAPRTATTLDDKVIQLASIGGYPVLVLAVCSAVRSALSEWRLADAAISKLGQEVLSASEAWGRSPDEQHFEVAAKLMGPTLVQHARRFRRDQPASLVPMAIQAALSVVLDAHSQDEVALLPAKAAIARVVAVIGEDVAWRRIAGDILAHALDVREPRVNG